MIALNLTATGNEQAVLKEYLQNNASEILADKINNGVRILKDGISLISKKSLDSFMKYACDEAKKQAEKGANSACIHSDTVFNWAIHYFEEEDIYKQEVRKMKTAVIYARYSSERQTEQSIEGQLRVCHEYAARNDIMVVDTYIDRATTGTNDNRIAFQKMLKDSDKKAWDIVLIYKLDRFSRNKYEMATHKRRLRDNGIKVVSAMENIPDTPEGIILESLLEGMAEYYSAELSQKVKRGLNESRQKGNFTGGYVLYGYKIENKKVVIHEDQANIVRLIYEQSAAGIMVKDIIEFLHKQGVMNRGKPIARNTVYNILKNEKYSGKYHYGAEEFDNMYPQIVPTQIYEEVRKRLDDNQYGKRSGEVVYLLRNKLICGYCGKPIIAETGTAWSGNVKRYYKCATRKRGQKCRKSIVRKEIIEQLIIDITIKTFDTPENIDLITTKILATHRKRMQDQSMMNILLKEKSDTERAISNLINAMEKGIVTSSTKKRLDELEILQVDLENKILIEQSKLTVQVSKDDIVAYIRNALKEDSRDMIDLLVDKIILYDDKIEIYFNYIDSKNPDDEHRDLLFYDGTTLLPKIIQNKPAPVIIEIGLKIFF